MAAMGILARTLIWLFLFSSACAQAIIDNLSFGHDRQGPISQDSKRLPHWDMKSVNHEIQILSDRIILTPPVPGNTKGSLWSANTVSVEDWTIEMEFRASGQDGGNGNIQLWYTNDKDKVNTNSVYNVEDFDGLALVIDQYGGRGGSIRAFLNDGSQNFRTASLDSLAFGHCDFSYRNLGRPSTIRVSNNNGLSVKIDDHLCFSSDKIHLPGGYHVGLTATTGENPDSFEIYHLKVSTGSGGQALTDQTQQTQTGPPTIQKLDRLPGAPEALPDTAADTLTSSAEQFADLHNRLQGLTHQITNIFNGIELLSAKFDGQHEEMKNIQGSKETGLPPDVVATIRVLSQKVENIESLVSIVRRDIESKDYREHLNELNMAVAGVHESLPQKISECESFPVRVQLLVPIADFVIALVITSAAPRMGMFVFIVLGVQVTLAGAYVVYKRRRDRMPKKYL